RHDPGPGHGDVARGGAAGSRCRALRGGTRPGRGGLVNRHRRRAGRQLLREDGNALVEFVVLSAVLLIPALYLVLTLGSVQSAVFAADIIARDRKSTRLNSSHVSISYAVFCLKKKKYLES